MTPSRAVRAGRLRGDRGGGGYTAAVLLWVAASVALCFVVVGTEWWASDAPLDTFSPRGEVAESTHNLVLPVFVVAGVVFVLVMGLVLWLSIRNRQSVEEFEDDDELPPQTHGNNTLEVLWSVIPFLLLSGIAVATVPKILELNDYDDATMTIRVEGQQWWWQYKYDLDGDCTDADDAGTECTWEIITANDLVIPVGEEIKLDITSNDVIHSFWIPHLAGKRDAVPGMISPWKIQADEPGRYRGQCTEFCGLSHARMQMSTIALPRDGFDAWLTAQQQPAVPLTAGDFATTGQFELYEAGRAKFLSTCTSCHTVTGSIRPGEEGAEGPENRIAALVSGVAPDLTHLMSRDRFAGAIFSMYDGVDDTTEVDTPVTGYLDKTDEAGAPLSPNLTDLEAWLRDPPAEKPMWPDATEIQPTTGEPAGRGMPNLGLSEEDVDALLAYLTTLH